MPGAVPARSRQYFTDRSGSGKPLAFGSVEVFFSGTDDHVDTYLDADLTAKNENPIQLNGYGECVMYLTGFSLVKFVVRDKGGQTIYEEDPVLVGGDKPLTPSFTLDLFNGNGVQTAFSLSVVPSSKNNTSVHISGTYLPKSEYVLDGSTIIFNTAPAVGTNNIEVQTIELVEFSASADLISLHAQQAADAATAAATSESNADTSEANALASQTAAALSAANASAAAAKVAFTSTALGLAGTVNGQTFAVVQPFGEGLDTYLNSAGTAVWQSGGAVNDLVAAEIAERTQPYTFAPVASVLSWQTLGQNGRGALNSARPKSRVFGRNMYAYVYGPRQQGAGPTVTPFFANGPTLAGTATRVQITVASQLFSVWTSAYRPPSGTYTVDFQVKSNTGADLAIRTGNNSDGYTARTALGAGWTRVQHQFTTNGTNWASFVITGDGANTPDILVDEMRIYPDTSANVPAIAADPQGDDFMPALAFSKARHSARLLDVTTSAVEGAGVLRVQGYPTAKAFTEVTFIAAASITTAASNEQLLTTDTTTALGTTNATLAITSTQADGSPDFSGILPFYDFEMTGQGVVVLSFTVKDGVRNGYVDNVEIGSAAAAFAGFSARMFRVGANAGLEVAYATTFRWQGLIGAAKVIDRYLSPEQVATEVAKVKYGLRVAGIALADIPAFLIALGDSQTSSGSGSRGPSWAYLQADAGAFTPNMPVRSLAVGGKTTQNVIDEQMPTALLMISQALSGGIRPIVAMFIGTNDQPEIAADYNNGVDSFTSPTGWWQTTKANLLAPLVAAGAKVAFATPLPDDASPPANWEAARQALRTKIMADLVAPDYFVMDFGATPGVGSLADTAGANYDTDHRHLTSAGHLVLKPVATAAINAARLAP